MTPRRYTAPGWLAAYAIGGAAWVAIATLAGWRGAALVLIAGAWLVVATASAVTRGGR